MDAPTVSDDAPNLFAGSDLRRRHARTIRRHVALLALTLAVVVVPNVVSFMASLIAE